MSNVYSNLSTPMGGEFKWLLKKEGGYIFDISLKNTPTSDAVSLALFVCMQ